MPELFGVRANSGQYTEKFLKGGYIAIGWLSNCNLSDIKNRDDLRELYVKHHPDETSEISIGIQVGQIARFLFDIKPSDFVITPALDTEIVYYGSVKNEPYHFGGEQDGCPYPHRRAIEWSKTPLRRAQFPVPFQNTIRSSLTVYSITRKNPTYNNDFFQVINRKDLVTKEQISEIETDKLVLNKLLELDATEFEILVTNLLEAVGFEGAEHTGKVGDEGVDAMGELNIDNLAKIKVYAQAKRYKLGSRIDAKTVRALRQNIPFGGQGVFITTAEFQEKALEAASEVGFPRIGTINGTQLVDLLTKHWDELPEELRNKLGLKKGLIVG